MAAAHLPPTPLALCAWQLPTGSCESSGTWKMLTRYGSANAAEVELGNSSCVAGENCHYDGRKPGCDMMRFELLNVSFGLPQ